MSVGYLIKKSDGLYGSRGDYYDYILAGNGVFIEAANPVITARIPVASMPIRGLSTLEPMIGLHYGKIPAALFALAFDWMLATPDKERFAAIVWENGYHLKFPDQDGDGGHVNYHVADNTILDLHSHGNGPALFSYQDNKDEQGFHLYGVIGQLQLGGRLRIRVGIYGYHYEIDPGKVFDGSIYCRLEGEEDELSSACTE
jgi:PRTRC genetic system protein A